MTYKKHKKDMCNRGAYYSFLQDPFKPTQSQRYFKKYFEVYESAYVRKNPRYHDREVESFSSEYGIVLNKVFKRKSNTRKRYCLKQANKKDRLYAKQYIMKGEFSGSTIKTHACSKTIAWCVD